MNYGSNGAEFTVGKSGDSPLIQSDFYIMFGHVDFVIQAAPGTGIVSSAVLQSDCLDEIDWEWLGKDTTQAQTNYFGKGDVTSYNRGTYVAAADSTSEFHKYSVDWTNEQIVWQIDGVTVRALPSTDAAANQYPQTPMMIKVGSWSGGDSSNPAGTIQWAGGETDYSAGPFTMYMKSIAVTDYSTGTQYTYSGTTGSWQSIQSTGGTIDGNVNSDNTQSLAVSPASTADTSTITASPSGSQPLPFEGTHADSTSSFITPSVYPWVGSATATLETVTTAATSIAGLPSGWTVNSSGKVVPPSSGVASVKLHLVTVYATVGFLVAGNIIGAWC